MKKQIINSLILLIVALTTLTVTVFAWFSIANQNALNNFILNTSDYSMDYTLEIKVNDEKYVEVVKEQEINDILNNLKPSDEATFKLKITYGGNVDNFKTKLYLSYIESDELLDEFYIKNGTVLINEVESLINSDSDHYLSSIIDDNLSILLINDLIFATKGSINEIIFTLVFDEESTTQKGTIKIRQIRIEG